jgi:hypothetical protein
MGGRVYGTPFKPFQLGAERLALDELALWLLPLRGLLRLGRLSLDLAPSHSLQVHGERISGSQKLFALHISQASSWTFVPGTGGAPPSCRP